MVNAAPRDPVIPSWALSSRFGSVTLVMKPSKMRSEYRGGGDNRGLFFFLTIV